MTRFVLLISAAVTLLYSCGLFCLFKYRRVVKPKFWRPVILAALSGVVLLPLIVGMLFLQVGTIMFLEDVVSGPMHNAGLDWLRPVIGFTVLLLPPVIAAATAIGIVGFWVSDPR